MKKKELRKIHLNKMVISRLDQDRTHLIKGGFFTGSCFLCPARTTHETSSYADRKCRPSEDFTTGN